MFPLLIVALALAEGPYIEVERNNANLELGIRVVEAFERGPVIVEASLKNRGSMPLIADMSLTDCFLGIPKTWKFIGIPCGFTSFIRMPLEPGEVRTERHVLHDTWWVPAGTYSVKATWSLRRGSHPVACPSKTFTLTVSPATPANRWALVARLEAEFAALPPPAPGEDLFDGPARELGEKLDNSRHKELVPLMLRFLDRYTPETGRGPGGQVLLGLVDTVFLTDPAVAHRAFVDRLLAVPPRVDPDDVFGRWWRMPERIVADTVELYLWRLCQVRIWLHPEWRQSLAPWRPLGDFIQTASFRTPLILPDAELRRLATAKDPEVRKLVDETFGDRLKR